MFSEKVVRWSGGRRLVSRSVFGTEGSVIKYACIRISPKYLQLNGGSVLL